MSKSTIKYSQANEYANEMHQIVTGMKELLITVNTEMKSVVNNGEWVGDGANHFLEKAVVMTQQFEELYLEMEKSVLFILHSLEGYQNIDQQLIADVCKNLKITDANTF